MQERLQQRCLQLPSLAPAWGLRGNKMQQGTKHPVKELFLQSWKWEQQFLFTKPFLSVSHEKSLLRFPPLSLLPLSFYKGSCASKSTGEL